MLEDKLNNLEDDKDAGFLTKIGRNKWLRRSVLPFAFPLFFGVGGCHNKPNKPTQPVNEAPDTWIKEGSATDRVSNKRYVDINGKTILYGGSDDERVLGFEMRIETSTTKTDWFVGKEPITMEDLSKGDIVKIRSVDNEGLADPTPAVYEVNLEGGAVFPVDTEIIVTENTTTLRNKTNKEGQIVFTNELLSETITAEARDATNNEPLEDIVVTYVSNRKNNSGAVIFEDTTGNYLSDIQYIFPTSGKPAGESRIFTSMNPAAQAPFDIRQAKKIPEYLDESEYEFLGTFPLSDIEQVYKDNDAFAGDASVIEFLSKNSSHPSVVLLTKANEARNTFLRYISDITRAIGEIFGGTMDPDAMYWNVYSVDIMGFPVVTKDLNTEDELCTVKGVVTDDIGNPLREVSVSIENNQTLSDSAGYYRLIRVKGGVHNIRFEKELFESFMLDTLIQPHPEFISTQINASLERRIANWKDMGKIVFLSYRDDNNEIYVMNPDGSNQVNLTNNTNFNSSPSWSPDGTKIAFSSATETFEIYVMNADGSNQTRLTESTGYRFNALPSWSPDGTKIAFSSATETFEIYVMNADGTNQRRLTNNIDQDLRTLWSPDGTKIFFESNRDIDNNGDNNLEIYVMNADGTNQMNLTNSPANDKYASLSPDGTQIAFYSSRDSNRHLEIHLMNADGTNQRRLTDNSETDYNPIWSPDGAKIAFVSKRDGNSEIYTMNPDGSNQINLTNNLGYDTSPVWSPH